MVLFNSSICYSRILFHNTKTKHFWNSIIGMNIANFSPTPFKCFVIFLNGCNWPCIMIICILILDMKEVLSAISSTQKILGWVKMSTFIFCQPPLSMDNIILYSDFDLNIKPAFRLHVFATTSILWWFFNLFSSAERFPCFPLDLFIRRYSLPSQPPSI